MKGFEIYYKRRTTKVAVEDGMLTANIFTISGERNDSAIYAGSVDYAELKKNIWFDWQPINIGDEFEIKVMEIDKISKPGKCVEDKSIMPPPSKLERFYLLEKYLKEKRVL